MIYKTLELKPLHNPFTSKDGIWFVDTESLNLMDKNSRT